MRAQYAFSVCGQCEIQTQLFFRLRKSQLSDKEDQPRPGIRYDDLPGPTTARRRIVQLWSSPHIELDIFMSLLLTVYDPISPNLCAFDNVTCA